MRIRNILRSTLSAVLAAGTVALLGSAANAQADKVYVMKLSTATINDTQHEWFKRFAALVEKDSGGKIKPEIYPASQLGSIPRQIEGTQFGSIQLEVVPPEFMVGLDQRFQVLAAPGLVNSDAQGHRIAQDAAVRKLMLGLGADRGLHGVGLFFAEASELISRMPLKTLADFKGKKVRIFASPFQTTAFERLGMSPVAMTLGDVVPGLQQGTIDAAVTGIGPVVNFHMADAAKYLTTIKQPSIFLIAEVNRKWFDALPPELQQAIEKNAAKADQAIAPIADKMVGDAFKEWTSQGGTTLELSPADHDQMMKTLGAVGAEVASKNPELDAAYKIVTQAAGAASAAAK
jgi:TRAP-type transport system periplasmic protein